MQCYCKEDFRFGNSVPIAGEKLKLKVNPYVPLVFTLCV